MRRLLTVLPTFVVLASLFTLAAMPATATQDAPTDHVLRINWGVGVPEIDPQFTTKASGPSRVGSTTKG